MTFMTATVVAVTSSGSRTRPRDNVSLSREKGLVSADELRKSRSIGTSTMASMMPTTIEVVSD